MSKQFMPCLAAFIVIVYCLPAYGQVELPEGRGKTAVQAYCLPCHDIGAIARSGHSETGWRNTLSMMSNLGSRLPKEEIEEVAKYLAANYPERSGPKAVLIPGEVNVSITEWPCLLPAPGPMILWRLPTARSGIPVNLPTSSGGSTPKPERSRSILLRPVPDRTG